MADLQALRTELRDGHPDTGPYDADDEVAHIQLHATNRSRNRSSMDGSEILNQVVPSEYAGLATENKRTLWDVVHLVEINPFGVEAALLSSAFGAGSATITALKAARTESISRIQEQKIGRTRVGDITKARRN